MAQNKQQRLDFKQSLVGGDKNLAASELVKRLKILNEKLCALRQEDVDASSCDTVAKELVTPVLLQHRDKGVRILVACCIGEILRIYAPEAPYNDSHLKMVFELFSRQMPGIAQFSNPFHTFYIQLLTSLAIVRSITLAAELDNAEDLITDFFFGVLDRINPEHPPSVLKHAADLLSTLIDESNTVPGPVVELVLAKFREPETNPQHTVAVEVARTTSDRLQKYVCQYFTDIILAAAKAANQAKNADLSELVEAHELMIEIFKHSPRLLLNVVPQLEEELLAENMQFRSLAIKTLGQMLTVPHQQLFRHYPQAWKSWLSRQNDKAVNLRIMWLSYIPSIFRCHATHLYHDLNACLENKLLDVDEKVRLAACEVISRTDFDIVRRFVKAPLLETLGTRIKDKKLSVRLQAMKTVTHLWSQVMNVVFPAKSAPKDTPLTAAHAGLLESQPPTQTQSQAFTMESQSQFQLKVTNLDDEEVHEWMTSFNWIPRDLLNCAYLNDNELTAVLENALIETVIHPRELKAEDWRTSTERLLWFLSCVIDDERSKRAFYSVLQRQKVTMTELNHFLTLAEEYNSLGNDTQTETRVQNQVVLLIEAMSNRQPDPLRSIEVLNKYVKRHEPDWSDSLRYLLEWSKHDFRAFRKTGKDVLRKIETSMPGSMQVLGIIARRVSPFIICHEMIPFLIERAISRESGWNVRLQLSAQWVLETIASVFPEILDIYSAELFDALEESPTLILRLLSLLDCKNLTASQKQKLHPLGKQPDYAMFVATILAKNSMTKECGELVQYSLRVLKSKSPEAKDTLTALRGLTKIVKYLPSVYEEHSQAFTTHILRSFMTEYTSEDEREWIASADLPLETQIQAQCIKVLTNRAVAQAGNPETVALAQEACQPVLKLLERVLHTKGSMSETTPQFAASALRHAAGRALLRIARSIPLSGSISDRLYLLFSRLLEDPLQPIRADLLMKTKTLLHQGQLSARYIPVVCLAANDPDASLKQSVGTFLKFMSTVGPAGKTRAVEHSITRFLHILAHTPAFSVDDIKLYSTYIDFFLDQVMRSDNVAYIYHVVSRCKEYRDRTPALSATPTPADSEGGATPNGTADSNPTNNLYVLADLSAKLIRGKCKFHSWPIATHSKMIELPADIFEKLPVDEARTNATRNYLPSSFAVPVPRKSGRKSGAAGAGERAAKKRRSATGRRSRGSRRETDEDEASEEQLSSTESAMSDIE